MLLRCPVRHCALPLTRDTRVVRCERGHSFDVARSGYVNLLQPGERRSASPGDTPEAIAARARFLGRGFEAPLVEALRDLVVAERRRGGEDSRARDDEANATHRRLALLDVGCGEGFFLRALGGQVDAHGVDISAAAVDLAARRDPNATFVVANADRTLPFVDASFDVLTSVNARVNAPEMRRVLRRGGLLVVVVPAPDDLAELREAVLGEVAPRERTTRLRAELAPVFTEEGARTVRHVVRMDADALRDALAATYRGARRSRRERVEALEALDVTLAHDLTWWR